MITQTITTISDLHLRKSTLDTYITPKNIKSPKLDFFNGNNNKMPKNVVLYTNTKGDAILAYNYSDDIDLVNYDNMKNIPSDLINLLKWMQSEKISFVKLYNTHNGELTSEDMANVFANESFLPFYDIPEQYVDTYQTYIQTMIAKAQK